MLERGNRSTPGQSGRRESSVRLTTGHRPTGVRYVMQIHEWLLDRFTSGARAPVPFANPRPGYGDERGKSRLRKSRPADGRRRRKRDHP
jgi:hypothetical protein